MRKKFIKGVFLVLCLTAVFFLFIFVNHQVRLSLEEKKYPPIGELIEVNGHNIHVYSEGGGEETLVFLAGWSTSSPVWDFKGLYSKLSDDYRIVIIERAGYGYSDVSEASRDIDTVLAESRLALTLAGIDGPYVLVPHSLAGLEALYWAQNYPHEVKAIMGLDISFPETYEEISADMMALSMNGLAKETAWQNFGFIRLNDHLFDDHEPIIFDLISDEEKLMYQAAVYRSYYTKDMLNEGAYVLENAKKVGAADMPSQIPMFLFIATEQGEEHLNLSLRYLDKMENGAYLLLEGGHYIHDFEPDEIADNIKLFLYQSGQ